MSAAPSGIKSTNKREYFYQLDGVRAIAASMVMVFHFSQALYPSRFFVLGQTGVDFFFVLSGFLISTVLLGAPHGDWLEVRKFYIRRVLRIFPLYYGYLLVASLAGVSASWWFWVYLQNFPMAWGASGLRGPNHFWSLAVEEQFYLVWPFLVLFWPRRWLAHAMWSTVALSAALRILLVHTHVSPFYMTFTRLDGLAAGGLVALYYQRGRLARARHYFIPALVLFACLLAAGARASNGHGMGWVQVTKFSAATGTYACMIAFLLTRATGAASRLLASAPMRAVGRVSYGLYVFHPAVIGLIATHLAGLKLEYKFVIFLASTYGVSLASFYGFEKRFTDLKEKFAPQRPPTPLLAQQSETVKSSMAGSITLEGHE